MFYGVPDNNIYTHALFFTSLTISLLSYPYIWTHGFSVNTVHIYKPNILYTEPPKKRPHDLIFSTAHCRRPSEGARGRFCVIKCVRPYTGRDGGESKVTNLWPYRSISPDSKALLSSDPIWHTTPISAKTTSSKLVRCLLLLALLRQASSLHHDVLEQITETYFFGFLISGQYGAGLGVYNEKNDLKAPAFFSAGTYVLAHNRSYISERKEKKKSQ